MGPREALFVKLLWPLVTRKKHRTHFLRDTNPKIVAKSQPYKLHTGQHSATQWKALEAKRSKVNAHTLIRPERPTLLHFFVPRSRVWSVSRCRSILKLHGHNRFSRTLLRYVRLMAWTVRLSVRLSSVCLSVTLLHPTQKFDLFGTAQ